LHFAAPPEYGGAVTSLHARVALSRECRQARTRLSPSPGHTPLVVLTTDCLRSDLEQRRRKQVGLQSCVDRCCVGLV